MIDLKSSHYMKKKLWQWMLTIPIVIILQCIQMFNHTHLEGNVIGQLCIKKPQ